MGWQIVESKMVDRKFKNAEEVREWWREGKYERVRFQGLLLGYEQVYSYGDTGGGVINDTDYLHIFVTPETYFEVAFRKSIRHTKYDAVPKFRIESKDVMLVEPEPVRSLLLAVSLASAAAVDAALHLEQKVINHPIRKQIKRLEEIIQQMGIADYSVVEHGYGDISVTIESVTEDYLKHSKLARKSENEIKEWIGRLLHNSRNPQKDTAL